MPRTLDFKRKIPRNLLRDTKLNVFKIAKGNTLINSAV